MSESKAQDEPDRDAGDTDPIRQAVENTYDELESRPTDDEDRAPNEWDAQLNRLREHLHQEGRNQFDDAVARPGAVSERGEPYKSELGFADPVLTHTVEQNSVKKIGFLFDICNIVEKGSPNDLTDEQRKKWDEFADNVPSERRQRKQQKKAQKRQERELRRRNRGK